MAEYVDRNEILKLKETITTDDYSGNETIDVVTVDEILGVESADVVERSEYVESQKEVMRLRDLSHKVNQDAMHYEEMYRELHRKINKAILALEREQNSEFWTSTFRDGIDYALKLLKKNVDMEEDNK